MHLRVASLVVVGLRTQINRVLVIVHLAIIVIAKIVVLI
jgi:hypothetical protein